MTWYIFHNLRACIKIDYQNLLLVKWETIEHHEVGFRSSPKYQKWKILLYHFYEPIPTVLHYR